jgi:hypothetical protein
MGYKVTYSEVPEGNSVISNIVVTVYVNNHKVGAFVVWYELLQWNVSGDRQEYPKFNDLLSALSYIRRYVTDQLIQNQSNN